MFLKTLSGLIVVASSLLPAGKAHAQTTHDTGSLRGRVTNENGIAIPGEIIQAKGKNGMKKVAESDSNGNFVIPFMEPGAYVLTVSEMSHEEQLVEEQLLKDVQILPKYYTSVQIAMKLTSKTDSPDAAKAQITITMDPIITTMGLQVATDEFEPATHTSMMGCEFSFEPGGETTVPVVTE